MITDSGSQGNPQRNVFAEQNSRMPENPAEGASNESWIFAF
jgi:hypothetical protein